MPTETIVRCFVRKEEPPGSSRTPRYVPLEIFNLWKRLMEERHGFGVADPVVSLWFEKGEASESSRAIVAHEPVTQFELFYLSEKDGLLRREVRYFPSADQKEYGRIRDLFLAHYNDAPTRDESLPKWKENPGVWILR
ncbi:MAG: hypothetical protein ABIH26_13735 [Candidatus Eisenbacteria bacterium]